MPFEKGNNFGKGRPSIVDEEKVNTLFLSALKQLYSKDDDDEAKIEFIKKLSTSSRGEIFIAEHLFGKPKEKVDLTSGDMPLNNFNLNDLSDKELFILAKLHERQRTNTDGESD